MSKGDITTGAGISCGRIAAVPMASLPYEGPAFSVERTGGACSEPEVSVRPVLVSLCVDVTGTECLVPMLREALQGASFRTFGQRALIR